MRPSVSSQEVEAPQLMYMGVCCPVAKPATHSNNKQQRTSIVAVLFNWKLHVASQSEETKLD
jgi:hypothetical protein